MKKAYLVYMDDGTNCFKVAVPAEDAAGARKYVEGNGEVIAIKAHPQINESTPISLNKIYQALHSNEFTREQIDLVLRALSDCNFID